jgi:endo-1,4-beta-xylanase
MSPAAVAADAGQIRWSRHIAGGRDGAADGRGSGDPEGNAFLLLVPRRSRRPAGRVGETLESQQARGGTTTYVLRVIDAFGQSDEDATAFGVVDTTAPALSLSVSPAVLSPPNHKLVPVTVTVAVSDVCDPRPTLRLVSITSNEGDLANGSGHTSPDIQDAQFGTDDRQFLLRAERSGTDRVYTITYEAEDADGNVALRQATVAVPQ